MSLTASSINAFVTLGHCALGIGLPDATVATTGYSLEYPLERTLSPELLARLASIGDIHVSSRVTLTASSRSALESLSQHVRAALEAVESQR